MQGALITIGAYVRDSGLGGSGVYDWGQMQERIVNGKSMDGVPLSVQRQQQIEQSKQARRYFFTEQNREVLTKKYENMTDEERERLQSV